MSLFKLGQVSLLWFPNVKFYHSTYTFPHSWYTGLITCFNIDSGQVRPREFSEIISGCFNIKDFVGETSLGMDWNKCCSRSLGGKK